VNENLKFKYGRNWSEKAIKTETDILTVYLN